MKPRSIESLQYREKGGRKKLEAEIRAWFRRHHKGHSLTHERKSIKFIADACQNNPDPMNNHFGEFYEKYLESTK